MHMSVSGLRKVPCSLLQISMRAASKTMQCCRVLASKCLHVHNSAVYSYMLFQVTYSCIARLTSSPLARLEMGHESCMDFAAAKRTKRKTTWLDALTQKKAAAKLVKKAQDGSSAGEHTFCPLLLAAFSMPMYMASSANVHPPDKDLSCPLA